MPIELKKFERENMDNTLTISPTARSDELIVAYDKYLKDVYFNSMADFISVLKYMKLENEKNNTAYMLLIDICDHSNYYYVNKG